MSKLLEKAEKIAKSEVINTRTHSYCPSVYKNPSDGKFYVAMKITSGPHEGKYGACCINAVSEVLAHPFKARPNLQLADSDLADYAFGKWPSVSDGFALYDELKKAGENAVAVVEKGKSDTMSLLLPVAAHINEKYVRFETVEKEATMLMLEIGVMLEAVKEQLPHGQLKKWIADNLTITYRHSLRFRELAAIFIKSNQIGNDEALLLCDPANSKEALGEKLRQMAFDFLGDKTQAELFEQYKIKYQEKAEPKQLHLPKPKPLADGETQAHRDATELIYPVMAQIHKYIVGDERVVQHFTLKELQVLQGDLIDAKRIVDGLIKAG